MKIDRNIIAVLGINGVGKTTIINNALAYAPEGSVAFNAADLMLAYLGLESRSQLEQVPSAIKEEARRDSILHMARQYADRPLVFLDTHMQIGIGKGTERTKHVTWAPEFNLIIAKGIFIHGCTDDIQMRRSQRPGGGRSLDPMTIQADQAEELQLFEAMVSGEVPTSRIFNPQDQLDTTVALFLAELGISRFRRVESQQILPVSLESQHTPRYGKEF